MRYLVAVISIVLSTACSSSTSPSDGSAGIGSTSNIAGSWTGSFASSNNETEQIAMDLTQSGSSISGTWRGTTLSWSGEVTGTVSASSFSGRITFSGTAFDDTVCTGTANVSGSVSQSSLAWTSDGVVGGSCPAPLPRSIRLDLRR